MPNTTKVVSRCTVKPTALLELHADFGFKHPDVILKAGKWKWEHILNIHPASTLFSKCPERPPLCMFQEDTISSNPPTHPPTPVHFFQT